MYIVNPDQVYAELKANLTGSGISGWIVDALNDVHRGHWTYRHACREAVMSMFAPQSMPPGALPIYDRNLIVSGSKEI